MNERLRECLRVVDFDQLCEQWGDTPYRLLIQEHVRKTKNYLPDAITGIVDALTETENEALVELFEHYYELACTDSFWKNCTASQVLRESTKILSKMLQDENCDTDVRVLFSGFNFITFNFAAAALYSKDFRKAIGIRKSLLCK